MLKLKHIAAACLLLVLVASAPVCAKSYLIAIDDGVDSIRLFERYRIPSTLVNQLRRDFSARVDTTAIDVLARPNPLNRFATENYALIIGLGTTVSTTVYNAAKNNDRQRYVMVDTTRGNVPENAVGYAFAYAEAGYLAGFVAAKTSQTGAVGFIGGQRISQTLDFARGFKDGAKYADAKIDVKIAFLDDFFDAYAARSRAEEMYRGKIDVVCHLAGPGGAGVLEAAQNYDKWSIGVSASAVGLPKNAAASVIVDYGMAVYEACRETEENLFEGGRTRLLNAANGGIDVNMASNTPAALKQAVEKLKKDIANGRVLVRNNNSRVIN